MSPIVPQETKEQPLTRWAQRGTYVKTAKTDCRITKGDLRVFTDTI